MLEGDYVCLGGHVGGGLCVSRWTCWRGVPCVEADMLERGSLYRYNSCMFRCKLLCFIYISSM